MLSGNSCYSESRSACSGLASVACVTAGDCVCRGSDSEEAVAGECDLRRRTLLPPLLPGISLSCQSYRRTEGVR